MEQSNSQGLCLDHLRSDHLGLDHLNQDRLSLDYLICDHLCLYRLACSNPQRRKNINEEADGEHRRRCTSKILGILERKQGLDHLAGLKPLQRKQRHEEVDGDL